MGKVIDLTGQRFGRLKVIRRVKNDKHYKAQFLCKCDCGNKIIAESHNLRSGNTSSCGCFRKELIVDRCRIDLTGQRFSRLIVIEYSHTNGKIAYWKCLCDCGNKTLVSTQQLKRKGYKNTRSCGCLQKERISEICGPNHYN